MAGKVTTEAVSNETSTTTKGAMDAPETAPIYYETEIDGKRVTLKRRLPAREGQGIMAALTAAEEAGDLIAKAVTLSPLIESWGFKGKPNDPETYAEMDFFDELLPLLTFESSHIAARAARLSTTKNAASASS